MGIIPGLKQFSMAKRGFSLFELLISLAIFSIVMGAFISLPVKTAQRSEELRDKGMALQQTSEMFGDHLKYELGRTKHLFPLQTIGAGKIGTFSEDGILSFDTKRQVFFAYYDPKKQRVYRLGYRLLQNESGGYNLFRANIGPNSRLADYSLANPNWRNFWKAMGKNSESSIAELRTTRSTIRFQYCQGEVCNNEITPRDADALRIVALNNKSEEFPIEVSYKQGTVQLPSIYFRLGSDITNLDASMGVYPFPVQLSQSSSTEMRLRDMTTGSGGARRLVINNAEANNANSTAIDLGDSYYNNAEGQLLIVGQSTTSNPRTFYITKLAIGSDVNTGFQTTGVINGANFEANTENNFPVTIQPGQAGHLGNDFTFRSVTQDENNEIYVLAVRRTGGFAAFLLHFSENGEFIAANNITGAQAAGTATLTDERLSDAYGIAYTPSTPEELHVLVRTVSNSYVVRTYDRTFDNNTLPSLSSHTAQSTELNIARVRGTFDFSNQTITGLEIIPRVNQYAIMGFNNQCNIVAFPINLHQQDATDNNDGRFGQPIDRGFLLQPLTTPANNLLAGCNGLAIDNSKNIVLTSNLTDNGQNISTIGLNTELLRAYP